MCFITYPGVSVSQKIMINFVYSDAHCRPKRGTRRQKTNAKHYCRVPFKKIRPDFIEDEATDAHSFYILVYPHHIPNGRETISLLPFDKRVPWPELPKPRAAASPLNDGQQTIVETSFFCYTNQLESIMSRVFKITPKRIKRANGTVLTPEMTVTVTTAIHCSNPFSNGAKEIKEAYQRLYGFDYAKACCNQNDFDYTKLD